MSYLAEGSSISLVYGGSLRGIGENMENATLAVGPAFVGHHSTRTRVTALIAALLLMLAMLALVQHVEASPAGATVAAAASVVAGADAAQLNFNQLFCSILISVRNAFANTPFAGFVVPILNSLIAGFGCAPS